MKAILFDLDGTIVDTIDLIVGSFRAGLKQVTGRDYGRDEIISLFGPTEPVILARLSPAGRYEEAERSFFDRYERDHDRLTKVFPGMDDLIRDCRARGFSLALITNKGARTTAITLEKCGLAPCFQAVITGDDCRRPKPDPGGLRLALERLGAAPEEAVFIGDSPVDIEAGRRAGVDTCAVTWGGINPRGEILGAAPKYVCESHGELRQLLIG